MSLPNLPADLIVALAGVAVADGADVAIVIASVATGATASAPALLCTLLPLTSPSQIALQHNSRLHTATLPPPRATRHLHRRCAPRSIHSQPTPHTVCRGAYTANQHHTLCAEEHTQPTSTTHCVPRSIHSQPTTHTVRRKECKGAAAKPDYTWTYTRTKTLAIMACRHLASSLLMGYCGVTRRECHTAVSPKLTCNAYTCVCASCWLVLLPSSALMLPLPLLLVLLLTVSMLPLPDAHCCHAPHMYA
jgi:hypothetical protein